PPSTGSTPANGAAPNQTPSPWKASAARSRRPDPVTSTQNKTAAVTGASSGIGEATARALAVNGYRVALLARRLDRIMTLADELGSGSIAIQADVTDRDSIARRPTVSALSSG